MNSIQEVQAYLDLIEERLDYCIEIVDVTSTGFKLETNYDFRSKKEISFPTTTEILDSEIAILEDLAYNLEDYYEWRDSYYD